MAQQGFLQPRAGFGSPAAFGSPLLGPDIAQRQYQLAQRQAYANALMQQANDPLQGQNVSGHYVAPSWTQGLAKALGTYLGAKSMAELPQQQQELQQMQSDRMAAQFGLGQGAQGFPVSQDGAQPQGMGQPQIPLLPGRSARDSFLVAQNVGLPAYFKMVGEQGNTMTDIQKNLVAQGIQPGTPQWNAALSANTEKQNYIAPPVVAPGSTLTDPRTGQVMFTAPKDGIQTQTGPDGVARAIPVPGYSDITAKQEGDKARATAGANAEFDLVEVPNPSGQGSTYTTRAKLAQQAQGGGVPRAKPDPRTGKADTIIGLATEADGILKNASSGLIGGLKTTAAEALGMSTDSSKADARLKVISGQLVMNMPRMEGPQSDADRLLYQQMAGDIANPKLPRETRSAALQTIIGLQQKYRGVATPRTAQEMQALPSGTVFRAPDGSLRKVP